MVFSNIMLVMRTLYLVSSILVKKSTDHFLILGIMFPCFFLEEIYTCFAQGNSYLYSLIL